MIQLQEPNYNVELLLSDLDYTFDTVKVFQDHLGRLTNFEEKVEYFMRMTSAMGATPTMLNAGNRVIERNGKKIYWGLQYSNNEEKTILHRLYFHRFYRTSRTHFLNIPRPDFKILFSAYSAHEPTERYMKLQLEWVMDEIQTFEKSINDWLIANPNRYSQEVNEQIKKASVHIERELEGVSSIKWDVFYRSYHLDPFALLWELIEYKRFLEINKSKAIRKEDSNLLMTSHLTIDNRSNIFNPPMPLDEVKRWFIQLAENNSKNGKPFLTVDRIDEFIERAFVGKLFTEKLSINERSGDKGNVIGLFHKFYTYCITHQPKIGKIDKDATAEKYIKLLTDYFDNWTYKEVANNFRSGGSWATPSN